MTHSPVSAESVEDDEDEDEKKKVCLPGFTGQLEERRGEGKRLAYQAHKMAGKKCDSRL